jgi:aminotransferase
MVIEHGKVEMDRMPSRKMHAQELQNPSQMTKLELLPYPKRELDPSLAADLTDHIISQRCAPSNGLRGLREQIACTVSREEGAQYDPEREILVTYGGMSALSTAFESILSAGDEVILFSPCYFFEGLIRKAGGIPVYVRLQESGGYAYDMDRLKRSINARTAAIVFNNPVNPTGYLASREEVSALAHLISRHNIYVVSDDSYYKMIYDGGVFYSLMKYPEIRSRLIVIRSFTKTYALPGWRLGYILADGPVMDTLLKVFEWNNLYGNYLSQIVGLEVMKNAEEWIKAEVNNLQENRDILWEYVCGSRLFSSVKPQGNPFMFINTERTGLSCERVTELLHSRFGIPSVPGIYHGLKDHVRIAFGGQRETIRELTRRLNQFEKGIDGGK